MILLQKIIESKYHYEPTWLMVIILFSIMLLGYLYSAFHSRFNLFLKAVFISRYSSQLTREERFLSHPLSLLLSLNFILVVSVFLLQILSSPVFFDHPIDFTLPEFLLIALIVLGVFSIKLLFLRIFANIIQSEELIGEYVLQIFLVNHLLGILLVPVVVLIAYGPAEVKNGCIYLGLAVVTGAFVFRIGKSLLAVFEQQQATLFYLILYLCTLEILPLLIGIKIFQTMIS